MANSCLYRVTKSVIILNYVAYYYRITVLLIIILFVFHWVKRKGQNSTTCSIATKFSITRNILRYGGRDWWLCS